MMEPKKFIEENLQQAFLKHRDSFSNTKGIYQLEIDEQCWHLDPQSEGIKAGKHNAPQCVIKMSKETLQKLSDRSLSMGWALISQKIKIEGDKILALKLKELFS